MTLRRRNPRAASRGLTLVELVLALGLLSVLMLFVFQLLDSSLSLWERSEKNREITEQAAGVIELFQQDLQSLESGERGDLVAEWVSFDTDGNGTRETLLPRLRLVRHASAAIMARHGGWQPRPAEDGFAAEEEGVPDPDAEAEEAAADPSAGVLEVCWAALPLAPNDSDPTLRAEALLLRGERALDDEGLSFFDDAFFTRNGQPAAGALEEVTGGLLWFGLSFATQTSILHDGWSLGDDLRDCAASWDGWNRGRPDPELHVWNEPGAGMPPAGEFVLLPRRVRLELEFEFARDRQRRPRTLESLDVEGVVLRVTRGDRLPPVGSFLRLDAEWMEVRKVYGDNVSVRRGARGSEAKAHEAGAMVHFGETIVREIPISLYREDWNL